MTVKNKQMSLRNIVRDLKEMSCLQNCFDRLMALEMTIVSRCQRNRMWNCSATCTRETAGEGRGRCREKGEKPQRAQVGETAMSQSSTARLRRLPEQDHKNSSKGGGVKWVSVFPFEIVKCCYIKPSTHFLPLIPVNASYLVCVCVYLCACFTSGQLNVDKISMHWIIPKTIPGNRDPDSGVTGEYKS